MNASNQDKDFEHIHAANKFDCEVEFASPKYAQLAIQGPKALEVAQKLTDVPSVRRSGTTGSPTANSPASPRASHAPATRARTASKSMSRPKHAVAVWNAILDAGKPFGIKPCGLGARNTLRLESKMALYGHEIGASITPFEADLAWIVKFDKGDFIGSAALKKQLRKRPDPQTRRIRDARPRHRARRLRSAARRQAGGLGDKRFSRARH